MIALRELLKPDERRELRAMGAVWDEQNFVFRIPKDADITQFEKYMNLTIDMTVRNDWKKYLLERISEDEYEAVKKGFHNQNNHRCVVCGNQGKKWSVEAHENWEYDCKYKIQTLMEITSLCPECHRVRHILIDNINNEDDYIDYDCIKHFMKVNKCTKEDFYSYYNQVKEKYLKEKEYYWVFNLNMFATIKKLPLFVKDYYDGEELKALLTDIKNYTALDVKLISDYRLQKKLNKFATGKLATGKPLKGKTAIRTKLLYDELLTSIKFFYSKT